jgi:hypothetical protein
MRRWKPAAAESDALPRARGRAPRRRIRQRGEVRRALRRAAARLRRHRVRRASWRTASTSTPGRQALLRETGTFVSHQPRSNMNNAVGAAEITPMLRAGMPVCLGNDGFSNDMFAEMKVADMLQKVAHGDPRYLGADKVLQMAVHQQPAGWPAAFFDQPRWGSSHAGRLRRPDPAGLSPDDAAFKPANLPWHILFGVSGGHVHSTISPRPGADAGPPTADAGRRGDHRRAAARWPPATWERYWALF